MQRRWRDSPSPPRLTAIGQFWAMPGFPPKTCGNDILFPVSFPNASVGNPEWDLTRRLDNLRQCLDSHLGRACTPKCGVSARRRVGMTFLPCVIPERFNRESRLELTRQLDSFEQCLDSHLTHVGMTFFPRVIPECLCRESRLELTRQSDNSNAALCARQLLEGLNS